MARRCVRPCVRARVRVCVRERGACVRAYVHAWCGAQVSAGVSVDGWRKGTKLYKIIWEGYLAAAASWEPEENIHPDILDEYEASLEAEAHLDAEEAAELEDDGETGG